MRVQWFLIAFITFSFLIPTSLAYDPLAPATVYVDDNYNAGTPGWGIDHFDNIQDGIDEVAIDGKVTVYAGTYDSITVNKRIVLEGQGRTYVIIDGGGSGTVVTLASDNINMSGFTITNADTGIDLLSDYNIISLCRIDNTYTGFLFEASDGNTIFYNDVVDNYFGMDLFDFGNDDNFIYHNNFLNCTAIDDWGFGMSTNRWNDTYPSGGNYWYDTLDFTDVMQGPNQNIPGSDGITDNNYTCGRTGVDYYPYVDWIYPPTESPPVLSDITPADETMFVSRTQPTVSVKITDTRTFDWTIEGQYVNSASGTGDTTGTKTATLNTPLPYFTNIVWYVNVTDSMFSVNEVYTFSTISSYGGTSLQETIDNAPSGADLTVPSGTYDENLQIDKPFTLRGINPTTTIIDGGGGDGITITSNSVIIKDFTITNCIHGIYVDNTDEGVQIGGSGNIFTDNFYAIKLFHSNYVTIEGNSFQRNNYGIYLDNSDQNTIDNNNLSGIFGQVNGNNFSIHLSSSDENTISDNIIHYNKNDGITLTQSIENRIVDNDIWRNANANPLIFVEGIRLTTSSHYNTISNNRVSENGDNGIWIEYSIGTTITENDLFENLNIGILMFFGTDNSSIGRNKIHSCGIGLALWSSNDNVVFRNNLSGNNVGGLYIYFSSARNKIYENDFIGYNYDYGAPLYQAYGIYIRDAGTQNQIFHNDFYSNRFYEIQDNSPNGSNTWDDGYPSGGNYYEVFHNDSQGAYDDLRGILQSESGPDGIVDTPYHGELNATDNYPLVSPYRVVELETLDFTWSPEYPKPRETVTFTALTENDIVDWQWDFGDITSGVGKTTTNSYLKAGYYVVSLEVIDNRGYKDTTIRRILIMPTGPFIPELQPPKYPGYTIPEMYDLLHATDLIASQSKVKVMVIDSGITPETYNGLDLSTIQIKHAVGWSSGIDENGHGTWTNYAVSYILKSKLPNSEQISYKIFGADGQSTNEMMIQALDEAKRMGVDVVSISAGAIGNPNDQFCRKVQELASDGIIVICAVGNFGPYTSTVLSPGCSLYSLSVAGSDPQWYGDTMTPERRVGILNLLDDKICEFSSRGPVPNVYPKPDVTAPAESIIGPWVSNGMIIEKTVSGTSMATPLVSGGVAVIIGQNKDLIEQVKTARFWDKGAVVVALQESIRESCYVKGGVNDWGAGIVQFDKVSKIYAEKLNGLIVMSYLTMFLPILLLIILIISIYLIRRGTKGKTSWGNKKRKSTWGKTTKRVKSAWKGW